MTDNDSKSDTTRLADLWDLDPSSQQLWQPDELGAILHHQLAAPLVGAAASCSSDTSGVPASAGELLHHPNPPLAMLIQLKDFAKSNLERHDPSIPSNVAKVLYCAAIAAALVKCHERITQLSPQELQNTLAWASAQPWLESRLRRLLNAAIRILREA